MTQPPKDSGTDTRTILLTAIIILLATSTGFLYYRMTQLNTSLTNLQQLHIGLQQDYLTLYNSFTELEQNYNESRDMYTTLRNEFTTLENDYTQTLQEKRAKERENELLQSNYTQLQDNHTRLQNEYNNLQQKKLDLDEIIDLKKEMFLENNKTLTIKGEDSILLTYEMAYAGYIQVNFNASTDLYFWAGSNITENEYYARYPAFPSTATDGSFITPVVQTIYLHITNPNYEGTATVNLTIKYYY